ncbi:MarR family transcriptional regulator [Sphingobium sp. H39-3-25]|uniref:MarR family transcriptional regulator n=1 Tax=Sphingobium arseniciresistens TaxID=3030834 RepID=UPI0023BA2DA9|nr:MarR family transcriptional regulator [Sphingobium arseniciresistens]
MPRNDLQRALAIRLPVVTQGWRQLADKVLAELGVSNSTGWCLIFLDRLGDDVRQIDLAREIGISQPSLVRTLDQLQASGLVERHVDPEDRRTNKLSLTAAGGALAARIETRLAEVRDVLLESVPDTDIEAVLRVCGILGDRIAQWRAQL